MNKTEFWQLIDDARANAANVNDTAAALVTQLAGMDVRDIMRWQHICNTCIGLSYKQDLWAVADAITGGCTDDGFEYFRGGLLARGRDVFVQALNTPESLKNMDIGPELLQGERILLAGWQAFAQKAGLNLEGDITQPREFERIQHHLDVIEAASLAHRLTRDEEQELAADLREIPDD